jgi:hypothetical protein
MVTNIKDKMQVYIQCLDKDGNKGTFLKSVVTGEQFGDTYVDLYALYQGHEIKFCKAHGIEIV